MNTELSNDEPVADGYRIMISRYCVSWIKVLYRIKKKRATRLDPKTVHDTKPIS